MNHDVNQPQAPTPQLRLKSSLLWLQLESLHCLGTWRPRAAHSIP